MIRGDNVMVGYWNKPEETAAALVDGWYHTGDLGYLDDEGYVYLVDRAKDMIVTRRRERVQRPRSRTCSTAIPRCSRRRCSAMPDARWGEAVHAVVVPRSDVTERGAASSTAARAIAGYKVPKQIELRTEPLPKSGAGKVLKRELREPYWAGHDAMVAGA